MKLHSGVIWYDGQEISTQADSITIAAVDNRPAYREEANGTDHIIYNNTRFGEQYPQVGIPRDIGGELAYLAYNRWPPVNSTSFIVYNGQQHGAQYGIIERYADIHGTLAYIASGEKQGCPRVQRNGDRTIRRNRNCH